MNRLFRITCVIADKEIDRYDDCCDFLLKYEE